MSYLSHYRSQLQQTLKLVVPGPLMLVVVRPVVTIKWLFTV